MPRLLLIDPDPATFSGLVQALASHDRFTLQPASTGREALETLASRAVSVVISELQLPDMSGLDVLRALRQRLVATPFLFLTASGTTRAAVTAIRLGAADFLEKPLSEEGLRLIAFLAGDGRTHRGTAMAAASSPEGIEPHAASRWARAVAPVVHAHRDPRTLQSWSRVVFAAPGTIRNWCRTAGVSSRRSLVFGRLLRAVYASRERGEKPENLLDVVDRRTLSGLLRSAGLDPSSELPRSVEEFVRHQLLIRDECLLSEILKALEISTSCLEVPVSTSPDHPPTMPAVSLHT